jgi:UDP-N-acetylmuramoylalanine--D-glutamate ligase
MSKKRNKGKKDLVVGLGATGLSIARYLKRNDASAIFYDSREEPPGLDALEELWPGAEVLPADAEFPNDIRRVVVSPGVADSNPILQVAYERKLEVISDIRPAGRGRTGPLRARAVELPAATHGLAAGAGGRPA